MRCMSCGFEYAADARFCSHCGMPVQGMADHPVEQTSTFHVASDDTSDKFLNPRELVAVEALPPGNALLIVQKGPGAGNRFLLDQDLVHVGRHPEHEIFLDDVTVSRNHAEFTRSGDTFTVRDVGSLNGTYVNRERVESAALTDGDEVQIGKFRLLFFAGHEVQ